MIKCEQCRFWQQKMYHRDGDGDCCVGRPRIVVGQRAGAWPVTNSKAGCGEGELFREKTNKAIDNDIVKPYSGLIGQEW